MKEIVGTVTKSTKQLIYFKYKQNDTECHYEVVLGELGWPVLLARRVLLRLFFWAKLTKMDDGRWVKRTS